MKILLRQTATKKDLKFPNLPLKRAISRKRICFGGKYIQIVSWTPVDKFWISSSQCYADKLCRFSWVPDQMTSWRQRGKAYRVDKQFYCKTKEIDKVSTNLPFSFTLLSNYVLRCIRLVNNLSLICPPDSFSKFLLNSICPSISHSIQLFYTITCQNLFVWWTTSP